MFGALAGLIQDDRKRLGESIDALQQTVKIGKIKRDMKSYLDTYGMDLSSENIRAHGKTVGNYDWKDALVEGIKQFRSAQSEGRYQESPGQITRDFSGKELTKGLDKVEKFTPIPFWDTERKAPISALNPTEAFEFFKNPTRYQRGGAPAGYTPPDEAAAIRLREAGRTNISIGDKVTEAALKTEAVQGTKYKTYLTMSPNVKDDAYKTAKESFDKYEWEDMPPAEKDLAAFKIMNNWYTSTFKGAQFGEVNGVQGWYAPDENNKPKLIKKW